ncbi:MAG: hypothetical protein GY861_02390 [bacterium]|nr:hypothetical protein [bacterium]
MNLYINGKLAMVSKTGNADRYGWTTVYVDGNSSCHKIPSHLADFKTRAKFTTSGNTYTIK